MIYKNRPSKIKLVWCRGIFSEIFDLQMNFRVITKKYAADFKKGLQKIDFEAVCDSLPVYFESEGVNICKIQKISLFLFSSKNNFFLTFTYFLIFSNYPNK